MQACAALFFLLIACLPAYAQSVANPTPAIPEDLQPWVGWVLHGHENERCPLVHGSDRRQCAWPSRLQLDLGDTGGKFSQEWHVDAPTWVPLPGDAKIWPQDVTVGGKDAVVVSREEKPHVELDPGRHVVSGAFRWDGLPASLTVPDATGLLALSVGGERILFPERDESGQVFLQRRSEPEEQDRLDVKVHRRILDDIPVQMTTRIDLEVAGKSREELLGRPLLDGFVPMALQSVLPVRLEPDGRLRVQVRPGTWTIDVVARHQGPVQELRLNEPGGPWDAQEVWVFEARNELRVVTIEGVPAIDPQQTELPGDWRALPAYALKPGESLRFVEKQRGDADPSPDRLSLQRTWWLDFDGGGYTVRDQLSGTMRRDWRLSMRSPSRLGHVAIDGQDQLITESPDGAAGVEVRQTDVRIEAESRVEGSTRNVDAVAWDHDVQSLGGELRLGPGWRLLHARGVDRASETWVSRWTLFDLFVVLLFAMAFSHLWGWAWGAAALLAYGITYIEPGAPGAVWAAVLVGAALVRVLPPGRWSRAARALNVVAFLVLLVDAVPFMVQQARQALYPALTELGEYAVREELFTQYQGGTAEAPPPSSDSILEKRRADKPMQGLSRQKGFEKYSYEVDPNVHVQTGPGMPQWYWRTISLEWSGPVDASQQLRLILIPPWLNRIIDVLRVLLLAALLLCIAREVRAAALKSGAAAILVLGLLTNVPAAQAELPSGDLLDQLRARLLEPPTCAPTCAASPEMFVEADAGSLQLRVRIDAAAPVAVPLPGRANQWIAEDILLDGEPAPALMQDDGLVWIRVDAGRHDVVLRGALPKRNEVQLHLPLLPHRVSSRVTGWTIEGVHEDGLADSDIVLVRVRTAQETATAPGTLEPNTLPPFVYVTRALRFGLTWEVETTIRRATPPGVATVVEVPLLPGEAVTTPDVRIAGGKVVVNLDAAEMEHEWRSILPQGDKVTLVAGDVPSVAEVWSADASPIWHVEATGIPTIHDPSAYASRVRRWNPWPGESVVLAITKPAAISGRTLTLDSAQVSVTPGLRATDVLMALTIRSSRGGEHTVTLPEAAELQLVDIDGTHVPIRQNERTVTFPLTPGSQRVQVSWRQPAGLGFRFVSPQVDIGAPAVNARLDIVMPQDRWTLFMHGPLMGPAVLFWGLLTVFLLVSIALGRVRTTPLAWYHWFLLSIGLTQVPIAMAMIVIAWLLMLGWRRTRVAASPGEFDLLQLLIVGSTVAALACLFFSIQQGLLGLPEMQVTGNGSTAYELRWFQDISGNVLPRAVVYSVPLLVYRLAMLLWALWLASALLRWLRWGWESFASGGLWRPLRPRYRDAVPPSSEGV